jgi:predicted phage tail protein
MREFILGVLGGVAQLLAYQAKPIETRVRDKQPSLMSVLVAEVRSKTGKVARVVLNAIGLE